MNYYNEFDPFAAQWLRNLIAAGLIPDGHVDERSIKEVQPNDLEGFTQCHFFAGIGGWCEALRLAAWPADVAVWTGSCPCQPFSVAGKRRGTADDRHLWPDFHRLIAESCPSIVFGEQVASKDGRDWLAGVRADLEALGYAVGAADLCSASVTSPNKRARLWWVADANEHEFRREPPAWEQSVDEQDAGAGVGLANTGSERRRARSGRSSSSGPTRRDRKQSCSGGQLGGVANPANLRSTEYVNDARERQGSGPIDSPDGDGTRGMGHASGEGQSLREIEQAGRGVAREERAAAVSSSPAWLRVRTIECRDGRVRRISTEPGDEPLAYGIPIRMGRGKSRIRRMAIRAARANRVGRLKGYGNAINPYVAAKFIRAYLDTIDPDRKATP